MLHSFPGSSCLRWAGIFVCLGFLKSTLLFLIPKGKMCAFSGFQVSRNFGVLGAFASKVSGKWWPKLGNLAAQSTTENCSQTN